MKTPTKIENTKSKTAPKFALPKKFKEKWIAALESGKYKKGEGRLYNVLGDTYCCLGVACRIVGIPTEVIEDEAVPCRIFSEQKNKLPKKLLDSFDFYPRGDNLVKKLVILNDSNQSFKPIINFIKKNC